MDKKVEALGMEIYETGEAVQISEDGSMKLPLSLEQSQQVLFVKTAKGYKLIPMVADVKKIYIEPSTRCNYACITCIRNSWEEEYADMDWVTFTRILESAKDLPHLDTVFFGGFGEPMLHPRIFDMLSQVKELGLKAEMITNGSSLNEEVINKLINLKLDGICVSFDSPEEEGFEEIRPGGNFKDVFANVQNLQRIKQLRKVKKPELAIEFVAMKKNFSRLPKLTRMAWELNAGKVIITNLLPYHESMKDEIIYDLDDIGSMFDDKSLDELRMFALRAQFSAMKLKTERECKFVKDKTMSINFKGEVSPCYALMHAYKCYIYGREKRMNPCYLGNVHEKSLREIWLQRGYMNFRETVEDFKFPSCADCNCVNYCNYTLDNSVDCWSNSPSCADCLWARNIIACP
jgi:tungsten cofactor oxidoreducase radical SAM maturase